MLTELGTKHVSRRRFLVIASAAGSLGVLTACSQSAPAAPAAAPTQAPPAATQAAPAAPTQAAQPKPTQAAAVAPTQAAQPAAQATTGWAPAPVTFVYADSADVSHIDPALITDFWSFSVTRNTYEPLVEI